MAAPVRFDDALPGLVSIVAKHMGPSALERNLFLRDASGRLTFVLIDQVSKELRQRVACEAASKLSPYVENQAHALATPEDLFDSTLGKPDAGILTQIKSSEYCGLVRVVERNIVGQDWLTRPQPPLAGVPPIIVFASLKGGVGRTTGLAVAAADLAVHGRNVLAVDLDLEGPGLGAVLLPNDQMPEFGTLDFFVENGLQVLDTTFLEAMIAISPLTTGRGLVHVVPATGRKSEEHPQNVLSKIARAYLEDSATDGSAITFLGQARNLIAGLATLHRYDAILIDARAGLNETTAAAILGLGADTLLFGVNTSQTFRGYRYLLAHLARFSSTIDISHDWRYRLRLVHAKAAPTSDDWVNFRDKGYELFSEFLYEDVDADVIEAYSFNVNDREAPHYAWHILNDAMYGEFDPIQQSGLLTLPVFERTFGNFLSGTRSILGVDTNEE